TIHFDVMRVEGADVYGSFLIEIQLLCDGKIVKEWNQTDLANFNEKHIKNKYVAKIKPGAHSLIIPLGAKATINLMGDDLIEFKNKNLELKLIDISGAHWSIKVQ